MGKLEIKRGWPGSEMNEERASEVERSVHARSLTSI